MRRLAELTTFELEARLARGSVVALVPVGSTEPHGPHLPLDTDVVISEEACLRAVDALAAEGVDALVTPSIPYGVTEFAAGFRGAVSVSGAALTAFVRAVVEALLAGGFARVCVVNNHLEPAHDLAIRAAVQGVEGASVACPLSRRWGRTLTDEFKSGACHAGRYETSLVLAARPSSVRALATTLAPRGESLSAGIRAGVTSFRDLGLTEAYTGAPAEATAQEGAETYGRLVEMIVAEAMGR
ncbi:MAG: creatininase family protein [Polyangiaceae bacterium]|nr:creatininase family protein [Polyangiaceae bacterium]